MPKRKRVIFTLQEKYAILKRLDNGESPIDLSKEYQVAKTTITDIMKRKTKINKLISQVQTNNVSPNRKTLTVLSNMELDKAVYKWYSQKVNKGEYISGPNLCKKAIQFNAKLGGPSNFQASTGWLNNFKSRNGIRKFQKRGEKLSAHSFKVNVRNLIRRENYSLENVYNADETGLNWRALPRKVLGSRREFAALGPHVNNDRITTLVCANASGGHRLPILVIGKSKKPKCLKHVNMSAMPIVYTSQKNAWMDSAIFMEWFTKMFIPSVKAHQLKKGKIEKTLLLLDKAPSHPSCDILNGKDELIKVIFLPPNVTLSLQPMCQGVIEAFKRNYRKEFLCKLILEQEVAREESLIRNYINIDLRDVAYMIGTAWDNVNNQILKKGWNEVVCEPNEMRQGKRFEVETNENGKQDVSKILDMLKQLNCHECDEKDVRQWLSIDNDDPGYQIMQDSEILEQTTNKAVVNVSDSSSSSDDGEDDDDDIINAADALTCLDAVLRWFEAQAESDQHQISVLKNIRDLAARKRLVSAGRH